MRGMDEQLRLVQSKAAVCCFALVLYLGFLLPGGDGGAVLPEGATFGSLVLFSPKLSCFVIAILAFILGVCVTLLCVYRRERRDGTEDEDR